jgi:membrane protease YdiL (CAAX protease family)
VPLYCVLTFAVSWGGMFLLIGPGGFPGTPEQVARLMGVGLVMTAGPTVVGLLLTGLVDGRAGLRDLLGRLLRWRVGAGWYAAALGIVLFLAAVVFAVLSLRFPAFVPAIAAAEDKVSLLLVAAAVGLTGGLLEEVGWTGFAIPRLLGRRGVFSTGLLVGVLWGAWHLLSSVWYAGVMHGEVPLVPFTALYFAGGVVQLTAYRVLMVWAYDRTGSLLLAVLMHAGLIVTTTPLVMGATTGVVFLTWFGASAAALWGVVAAVALANGGHLARDAVQPAT